MDGSIVNSRSWQNILHITGVIYSSLTISGAVLIGSQNYTVGLTMMIIGAIAVRITSEVEFRKQCQLFSENKHK